MTGENLGFQMFLPLLGQTLVGVPMGYLRQQAEALWKAQDAANMIWEAEGEPGDKEGGSKKSPQLAQADAEVKKREQEPPAGPGRRRGQKAGAGSLAGGQGLHRVPGGDAPVAQTPGLGLAPVRALRVPCGDRPGRAGEAAQRPGALARGLQGLGVRGAPVRDLLRGRGPGRGGGGHGTLPGGLRPGLRECHGSGHGLRGFEAGALKWTGEPTSRRSFPGRLFSHPDPSLKPRKRIGFTGAIRAGFFTLIC